MDFFRDFILNTKKILSVNSDIPFDIDNILEKFSLYTNLLLEYNEKINLTAITDKKEIYIKHYIDSLSSVMIINGHVIDIGTGAGFPSIPLAIIREDVNFTLVDSLNKRIVFLEEVKKCLGLKNIRNLHARAEDLKKDVLYDYAVARAVAPLNILCEYTLPFVKENGYLIAYKGSGYKDEMDNSKKALETLGAKLDKVTDYKLELEEVEQERFLLHIKKVKPTPKQYPRAGNKPRTKPL